MPNQQTTEKVLFMKPTKFTILLVLVILLAGGLAVRLIDFSDLPLDYAATRELHSFIMARGIYYQMDTHDTLSIPENIRQFGIVTGNAEPTIEPPIFENLVALTYRLIGHENMGVARMYSIFFWLIGGIGLFLLARKILPINGAFAALALYLFTQFAAIVSRSFQPDPLMIMFIVWAFYFQIRWFEKDSVSNAILAGLFTGLAILVKAPAVFFVGITMAGLVLLKGIKRSIRNWRVYLILVLSLIPAITYNYISATVGGNAGAIFGARWFPNLFIDPQWYLNWLKLAVSVVRPMPFVLGLFGFFFIREKSHRIFYFCMWLGYFLYGFMFAYHIFTHDYYHLPLIPIVALGFGAVVAVLFEKLEERWHTWLPKAVVVLLVVFSLMLSVQRIRGLLVAASYRHEAKYWQELGDQLGHTSAVIALTHDYGYRLSYWGFVQPQLWPTEGDLNVQALMGTTNPSFEEYFKLKTEGKDYFLVTLMNDFTSQKDLHDYLFANYPYSEGDGYYIFDLKHPLSKGTTGG